MQLTPLQRNLLTFAAVVALGGGIAVALLIDVGLEVRRNQARADTGPCMLRPDQGTYRRCTTPGDGTCDAYSVTCEPSCMYDAHDGRHKRCPDADMGRCPRYGEPCVPACMYDPAGGVYRECDEPGAGVCLSFGARCVP